jgi:hypothetical protein
MRRLQIASGNSQQNGGVACGVDSALVVCPQAAKHPRKPVGGGMRSGVAVTDWAMAGCG